MLEIRGTKLESLPIDLEWVKDLIEFDGPLLSLFKHRRRGDNYLYYWCDCDNEVNRWMVCRVNETTVIRLINRVIPLDQVIPRACQDDFVYIVDMDGKCDARTVRMVTIDAIPEQYVPAPGAFLSPEVADTMGTYAVLIERNLSIENWRDFFKEFSYAYAFLYNVVTLKSQKIIAHPWRGGFSALHFWREFLDFVPAEDYPQLEAMQYASPGFIRFRLDSSIAVRVGNLVASYVADGEGISDALNDVAAYFRTHHLNEDEIPNDVWEKHNDMIVTLTYRLLEALGVPADEFISAANRPFEAAKMAMSFTRRIAALAAMESDRLIRFPNLEVAVD